MDFLPKFYYIEYLKGQKMKSENKKRSIFDIDFLMAQNNGNILNEVEIISAAAPKTGHVLSKNIELNDVCVPKNDIVDLIKTGYNLPEADEPEKMLSNTRDKKESVELCNESLENAPFRMVNLISGSYRLPEVETNDFMK